MQSSLDTQIIGLVRFSYLSLGGFARQEPDPAREAARLYDEARLERRFQLFEALTLPSLLAQSDGDFAMVFLTGSAMPQRWRDRLRDDVAALPGARVVALAPLQHYQATRRALVTARRDGATHVTSFRLDDDDALDVDHIARMRRTIAAMLPATGMDRPLVTGCNRGFFLELRPEGNLLSEVTERFPGAQGLAITEPAATAEFIYRRNHRLVAQFFNTYSDATVPGWIRTIHRDNDSGAVASGRLAPLAWPEAEAALRAHFPFAADRLQGL